MLIGERVLKIGQQITKLYLKNRVALFSRDGVEMYAEQCSDT